MVLPPLSAALQVSLSPPPRNRTRRPPAQPVRRAAPDFGRLGSSGRGAGLDRCQSRAIGKRGGFAGRVLPELAQATLQSCRHVFGAEIPHYFRHLFTDNRSVAPRVEYAKTGVVFTCVMPSFTNTELIAGTKGTKLRT